MDQIEIGREKIGLFFGKEKGPCFNISIRNEEDSHIPSDHGNGKIDPVTGSIFLCRFCVTPHLLTSFDPCLQTQHKVQTVVNRRVGMSAL